MNVFVLNLSRGCGGSRVRAPEERAHASVRCCAVVSPAGKGVVGGSRWGISGEIRHLGVTGGVAAVSSNVRKPRALVYCTRSGNSVAPKEHGFCPALRERQVLIRDMSELTV